MHTWRSHSHTTMPTMLQEEEVCVICLDIVATAHELQSRCITCRVYMHDVCHAEYATHCVAKCVLCKQKTSDGHDDYDDYEYSTWHSGWRIHRLM
jgi:hypothetical protein